MGWTGTQNVLEGGRIERVAEADDLALILEFFRSIGGLGYITAGCLERAH